MPKYIANGYLVHKGKIVPIGDEVELTEEQGERLGDKVTIVEVEDNTVNLKENDDTNNEGGDEKPLEEYTVPELKEIAKEKEIEGHNNMNKGELIEALQEVE